MHASLSLRISAGQLLVDWSFAPEPEVMLNRHIASYGIRKLQTCTYATSPYR
ncbi:DUF905 family protein [Serratia fonticola]|uniref:DUF905 family protein n=1 Tax=Serratia fonticola TaxID=47917 RepID=UPI0034C6A819